MKSRLLFFALFFSFTLIKAAGKLLSLNQPGKDTLKTSSNFGKSIYEISDYMFEKYPYREIKDIIAKTPGINNYNDKLYFRGSEYFETEYYIGNTLVRDPLTGLPFVSLPLEAIDKIEVSTGGSHNFDSPGSGFVRSNIKTGSDNFRTTISYISDNFTFKSRNSFFDGGKNLGAFTYGHNEFNFNISGPLFSKQISFFVNFNNKFKRDKTPQDYPGINLGYVEDPYTGNALTNFFYPAGPMYQNKSNEYNLTGSLLFDFDNIKINLNGNFNSLNSDIGNERILGYLNSRIGEEIIKNKFLNFNFEHVVSAKFSYKIYASYANYKRTTQDPYLKDNYKAYGDSTANANAGWVWNYSSNFYYSGNFAYPKYLSILGFSFVETGRPMIDYSKREWNNVSFGAETNYKFSTQHNLSVGFNYSKYKIRSWSLVNINAQLDLARNLYLSELNNIPNYEEKALLNAGVNNYGYDYLGNKIDDDFFEGPHSPYFAKFFGRYIGNFGNFNIDANLTYHSIDYNYIFFADPLKPDKAFNGIDYNKEGWEEQKVYTNITGGIAAKYNFNKSSLLSLTFGKYLSNQKLEDIYIGINKILYYLNNSFFFTQPTAPHKDIKPILTDIIELSFCNSYSQNVNFTLQGYLKNIKNQPNLATITLDRTSNYSSYRSVTSTSSSKIRGIETILEVKNLDGFNMISSFEYQNFKDKNTDLFLEYNYEFKSNHILRYELDHLINYTFFKKLTVDVVFSYLNGHSYNKVSGFDPRSSRFITQGKTPSLNQFDIKINKEFTIYEGLEVNLYLTAINLFNTKNVINVFPQTGKADDNGYITNPNYSQILIETYGEIYKDLYNAVNIDYYSQYYSATNGQLLFGPPRQIMLGVNISY